MADGNSDSVSGDLALAPVAVLAVPTVGLSATVGAGAIIVAAASPPLLA